MTKHKPPKNFQDVIINIYDGDIPRKTIADIFGIAESYVSAVIRNNKAGNCTHIEKTL